MQPRQIEQLIAREDALRGLAKGQQEVELAVAEWNLKALRVRQATRQRIELPACEAVGAAASAARGRLGRRPGLVAAQHGAHASQQLAIAEGLGDVVIGRHLEPHHAVCLVAPGRHDDDGDVGLLAQLASQLHAVLSAQPQVEQHQVDGVLPQDPVHVRAAVRGRDAKFALEEISADQVPHERVVIDDEDVGGVRRHAGGFAVILMSNMAAGKSSPSTCDIGINSSGGFRGVRATARGARHPYATQISTRQSAFI